MMHCPKCEGAILKESTIKTKNINLDRCPTCKGLWFDKGELNTILSVRAVKELVIPNFSSHHPNIKCPKCHKGMHEFCYPGTTTFVDACTDCGGIWLDNLEWKEISVARDIKNKISCPKCNELQKKSGSCVCCGIIFSKYNKVKQGSLSVDDSVTASVSVSTDNSASAFNIGTTQYIRESYADDIPGLKGILLRFIDRSIDKLTAK